MNKFRILSLISLLALSFPANIFALASFENCSLVVSYSGNKTIYTYTCPSVIPFTDAYSYKIEDKNLYQSLKGKIILRTERKGEAYYVSPTEEKVYFLGSSRGAFQILQSMGVGMTDAGLSKISAGYLDNFRSDSDMDGLSDDFENAFGSNAYNSNSDRDRYSDKVEILNNYNPNGANKLPIDLNFTGLNEGRVFLQVQRNGEMWYVNPTDGRRYFVHDTDDARSLVEKVGLGISENNFFKLIQ